MHIFQRYACIGIAVAALALSAPSRAQVSVQFDTPITSISSPSGDTTLTLTGSITNAGTDPVTITGGSLPALVSDGAGDTIPLSFDGDLLSAVAGQTPFAPGTTTFLSLVDAQIGAGQAAGLYDISGDTGTDPVMTLDFSDGSLTSSTFDVAVTPPAPVPEPSQTAALGLGFLCLSALVLKTRRARKGV